VQRYNKKSEYASKMNFILLFAGFYYFKDTKIVEFGCTPQLPRRKSQPAWMRSRLVFELVGGTARAEPTGVREGVFSAVLV